jgi:peptidoglycan/xylan/chitin deacetylase (PgdA/CDA1 family)
VRAVRRVAALLALCGLLLTTCGPAVEELDAVPVPDRQVAPTPDDTVAPDPARPAERDDGEPTDDGPGPSEDDAPSDDAPSGDGGAGPADEPAPVPEPAPQPPATLPPSLLGAEWQRIPTSQKVVALTFDAGANADAVASILGTLDATRTPATFFLTGRWTERYPDLAARIAARYPVGNHSVTHPRFTDLTAAQLRQELEGAEATIRDATGVSTVPLFRFPFGDRDARTIELVNDAGYGSFRWTVDTLGWQGTSGGMSVEAVVDRVLDTAGAGQIVLMHVGSHPTDGSMLDADALPTVVRELRARGYRFVTLREALELGG